MDKAYVKIFLLLVVTALFVYFSFAYFERQNAGARLERQIVELEDMVRREKKDVGELKRLLTIINTDEYVEIVARKRLGLVKSGEQIFIDSNR